MGWLVFKYALHSYEYNKKDKIKTKTIRVHMTVWNSVAGA